MSKADFEKLVRVVPKAGTTYILRVYLGNQQVGVSRGVTPAEARGTLRSEYVWEALREDLIRYITEVILRAITMGLRDPVLSTVTLDRERDVYTDGTLFRLRVYAGEEFEVNDSINSISNLRKFPVPEQEVIRRMAADVANQIVSAYCPLDDLRGVS